MSDSRNAWVKRVLGVNAGQTFSLPPPGDTAAFMAARNAWREASETVDGQIAALARALRASGDEELEEIGEFGMNALTAGYKVPLMAALMELGSGSPEVIAKTGPKALAVVRAFRKHIDSDPRIAVCDDNPLGLPVSIRATLGPALAQLEMALTG